MKTPRYGGVFSCCGGCRRANSHNIFVQMYDFFVGVMFVFVTFAVIKIPCHRIKRKHFREK
jgi:hypothetical protein